MFKKNPNNVPKELQKILPRKYGKQFLNNLPKQIPKELYNEMPNSISAKPTMILQKINPCNFRRNCQYIYLEKSQNF